MAEHRLAPAGCAWICGILVACSRINSHWLKQTRGVMIVTLGHLLEPKDEEAARPRKETGPGNGLDPLLAVLWRQKMAPSAPEHRHLHFREQPRWN